MADYTTELDGTTLLDQPLESFDSNEMCPVIKINNFKYPNAFLLIMKVVLNPYQVLNDEPILLNPDKLSPSPNDVLLNGNLISESEPITTADEISQTAADNQIAIQNEIDNIIKMVDDIQNGNVNGNVDCPNPDNFSNLSSDQYFDTNTITFDDLTNIPEDEPVLRVCDEAQDIKIVNEIPIPDWADLKDTVNKPPENVICNLNDSVLQNTLDFAQNIQTNMEDLNNLVGTSALTDLASSLGSALGDFNNNDGIQELYDSIKEESQQYIPDIDNLPRYLGIPLATLNKEREIYFQIVNKKLQVNIYSSTNELLELDNELNINDQYIFAFKTDGNTQSIYAINENTGEVSSKTIFAPFDMSIYLIGSDIYSRKHFCGQILDLQIRVLSDADLDNYLNNTYNFQIPAGCLAFYDWHKDRIYYNLVYPLPDLKYPVKMYGNFNKSIYELRDATTTNPYRFMNGSYLSEFFCTKILNQDEFSFNFWFKVTDTDYIYNDRGFSDFRTIIDDDINGNRLEYDKYSNNFRFKTKEKQDQYYNFFLDRNKWYNINFKYLRTDNKITFNIRPIDDTNIYQCTFDVDENFKFNLMTMLASYNSDTRNYENFFDCHFGTLAIFNRFISTAQESTIFNNQKIVLIMLNL